MEKVEYVIDNYGVPIHCIEYNASVGGTPVVIVPGMINSAEDVAQNVEQHLTKRTIIISLRGRGKSGAPLTGWKVEHQASDVAAVIDHFGLKEVVLFGHSTGGSIAARALPMIKASVRHFFIGDFPPLYPPYDEGWKQHVLANSEYSTSTGLLDGIVREAEYTDVSNFLKPVASRLTLIVGEPGNSAFREEDISRLKEMFPQMTVEIMAGCGHEFLIDDPQQSVAIIESRAK